MIPITEVEQDVERCYLFGARIGMFVRGLTHSALFGARIGMFVRTESLNMPGVILAMEPCWNANRLPMNRRKKCIGLCNKNRGN